MATLSHELLAARLSLDEQGAALSRVLDNVRHQHATALRLRSVPGWKGEAERRSSARVQDLADVLGLACAALERAVCATGHAVGAIAAGGHDD